MKILKIAALAALAVAISGCGNKPKLPEGTIAAAYVVLGKAYSAGQDIAKIVIKNLPKEFAGEKVRETAEKSYEDGVKQFEDLLKAQKLSPSDIKWVTAAIGNVDRLVHGSQPDTYLVARVKGITDLPLTPLDKNIAGEKAYNGEGPLKYVIVYDKEYVFAANTEAALELLLQTHKGDKPCADGFDGLMDLSGSTIARIQMAGISKLLENPKLQIDLPDGKKTPADAIKYALDGIDEDMGDYLTELESLTLDINVAEDALGAKFTVACGSSGAAKLVDQVFGTLALFVRIQADTGAVMLREFTGMLTSQLRRQFGIRINGKQIKDLRNSSLIKSIVKTVSKVGQDIETDRSGSEASISFSIPLDDLVRDVLGSAQDIEKVMKNME